MRRVSFTVLQLNALYVYALSQAHASRAPTLSKLAAPAPDGLSSFSFISRFLLLFLLITYLPALQLYASYSSFFISSLTSTFNMPSLELAKNAQQLHPLTTLTKTAAIDDVFTSDDTEKPISGGFFTVSADGPEFVYTYKYDELKIIVEGTIVLEDRDAGIKIEGHPGDVINIKKGTTVTFTSPNFGKAFYVGQRKLRDF